MYTFCEIFDLLRYYFDYIISFNRGRDGDFQAKNFVFSILKYTYL